MRSDSFITYEYKELNPKDPYCAMMIDSYENFGWNIDDNIKDKIKIVLKRNQKIINKVELTRLQRNFESCLHEIEALNKSKHSSAAIAAILTGLVGTFFMALSVFAATATPINVLLCIVFGVPAMILWILPIFIYKYFYKKREQQVTPLIDQKYDEIYEVCRKGYKLLHE